MADQASDEATQEDLLLNKTRFKNRRRMAWLSFIQMTLLIVALLFAPVPTERFEVISEPIIWALFAYASIIGTYMGTTVWAAKR